jgi:hypothetical protein
MDQTNSVRSFETQSGQGIQLTISTGEIEGEDDGEDGSGNGGGSSTGGKGGRKCKASKHSRDFSDYTEY